jgi:hypothetical protein
MEKILFLLQHLIVNFAGGTTVTGSSVRKLDLRHEARASFLGSIDI